MTYMACYPNGDNRPISYLEKVREYKFYDTCEYRMIRERTLMCEDETREKSLINLK